MPKTETVHLPCETVNWRERTQAGYARYLNAMAYVWGREDAGDRKLRLALQRTMQDVFSPELLFANFAANEADAYQREEVTSLQCVQMQYDRFLEAIKAGAIADI